MAVGRRARAVAAVVAAALLGACTEDPTPDPTPTPTAVATAAPEEPGILGDRVAVIVPPHTLVARGESAPLFRAAEDLRDSPPPGVSEVRVARADSEAFARDLANLAVDDGFDLVCIVGTGAAELALELARARRDTSFCTTDGRIAGGPVNLVAVALDPMALIEVGVVAIGTAPAPVGLLLSEQVGDAEALTSAFTSAVSPPRRPSPPPPPPTAGATAGTDPAPAPTATDPEGPPPPFVTVAVGSGRSAQLTGGEDLAARGTSRALVLATPGGDGAAHAVGASGTEVVVVADWAVDGEGELPPGMLVGVTVEWGELLRAAVAAGLEEDSSQVRLLGTADGLLAAVPGSADEGDSAAGRTNEHLSRAAE